MASDRRFGLPHPFDAEPSEDSSAGRKPGLWETLKRALGTAPAAEPGTAQPVVRDAPEPRAPAAPPRPAAPQPAAPPPVESAAAPALSRASAVEPVLEEVAAAIPFLDDLSVASPPPVESPPSTPLAPPPPPEIAPPGAPERAPAPPRLARGLASFSRDNAKREKKFAHLLRDSPPDGGKGPPESRKRR